METNGGHGHLMTKSCGAEGLLNEPNSRVTPLGDSGMVLSDVSIADNGHYEITIVYSNGTRITITITLTVYPGL